MAVCKRSVARATVVIPPQPDGQVLGRCHGAPPPFVHCPRQAGVAIFDPLVCLHTPSLWDASLLDCFISVWSLNVMGDRLTPDELAEAIDLDTSTITVLGSPPSSPEFFRVWRYGALTSGRPCPMMELIEMITLVKRVSIIAIAALPMSLNGQSTGFIRLVVEVRVLSSVPSRRSSMGEQARRKRKVQGSIPCAGSGSVVVIVGRWKGKGVGRLG